MKTIFRDFTTFFFMRQIIFGFIQKVFDPVIIDKIFFRNKEIQKFFLIICQQKRTTAHNIKRAERNTGAYAPQRNIQIDFGMFKYMRFPGPGTVYMQQDIKFLLPVKIGDTITATVALDKIINPEKGILELLTEVYNQNGEKVISGKAIVKAP